MLADQAGNGDLATVENEGKSIALIPVQANKVKGAVKGNEVTYPGILLIPMPAIV